MSYTINHFQTLIEQFPTWDTFKAHVTSEEGSNLRVIEDTATDATASPFAIIRYVKERGSQAPIFRSVVWNKDTHRPVCMAPVKAREGLPLSSTAVTTLEDFVEGVMVNVFTTAGAPDTLHIATRTVLGATTTFYDGTKSFSQMFDEALQATPLKDRATLLTSLKGVLDQVEGSTAVFASFVLQHPEHRVVAKPLVPGLYCVHIGTVTPTGAIQMSERAMNWPREFTRLQIPTYPVFPFSSQEEIDAALRTMAVQRGWRWQGLVFKDGAGGRWRIRTPTYLLLRDLRGGESTVEERFIRLFKEKKVDEYLKHYNEDRKAMWACRANMNDKTGGVFNAYCDVHKARSIAFKDLPDAYKPAVYLLHLKWRNELRERGFTVRFQNAIEVVNSLKPFELLRLLKAAPYIPAAPVAQALAVEPHSSF